MAEVRTGIRHLLAMPILYDMFQHAVGAYAWRRRVMEDIVIPVLDANSSVLDIGCGTADVVSYLPPSVRYVGFDRNPSYIEKAKRRYSRQSAQFRCEEFSA